MKKEIMIEATKSLELKEHKWISQHISERNDECSEELFRFISNMLRIQEQREIRINNDKIYDGINFLSENGIWVDLVRLIRNLPNEIIKAAENDNPEMTNKTTVKFAEQVKQFMELSTDERDSVLNSKEK
jgi:hypothetical protein